MNPLHAQRLLRYMAEELRIEVDFPVMCDLHISGELIPASTHWYTDDSGACMVKATVNQGTGSKVSDVADDVILQHENMMLVFRIQSRTSNRTHTRFTGTVQGRFGQVSELVKSTSFLIRNLPENLSSLREITRVLKIDDQQQIRETQLDRSAMILRDDRWIITLDRIDQDDTQQCDYLGTIAYGDRELRRFSEHLEELDVVSLFLTWICGSIRRPSYAFGYQGHYLMCGYINSFHTPQDLNYGWFMQYWREEQTILDKFASFSSLLRTPEVSLYIKHAVTDYAESYNASSITSKLANTHSALTAIARWDRRDSSKKFSFYRNIKKTIACSGLDGTIWNPVAKRLDEYRNNILHVQPKWSYHDDPSTFQCWHAGQELVENLLIRKLGINPP